MSSYPKPTRRLRLGFVGGGQGALVGQWHAMGARMSNRWDIVAGALSSKPEIAKASGKDWQLAGDRSYSDFGEMAQKEASREDGIDAVAICTPNGTHAAIAEAFMKVGIDVICDKPMTATLEEAERLAELERKSDVFFGVTYTYAFHAMVRQAKAMIAKGDLGKLRQAHVEYVQDWATGAREVETKQSGWRRDPAQAGRASVTGDIGTHAYHMLYFVTGKAMADVSARFHVCGGAAAMEDTAFMQLRSQDGMPATLWCTQAAPGNACGLRFKIYGEKGGLEWDQEQPELLHYTPVGEPTRILSRGHGAGMLPQAERMVRLPRGHGEALSDAWCNLYTEFAIGIEAHRSGEQLETGLIEVPDIADGMRGMMFIEAAADSADADGAWRPCWFES